MSQVEKNKLSHQPEGQWDFLKSSHVNSVDSFSSKAIANFMAQKLAKLNLKSQKNRLETLPPDLFEYLVPSSRNSQEQKSKPKKEKLSPGDSLLKRIAFSIAQVESQYSPTSNLDALESDFFHLMARGEFVPEISLLKNITQGGYSLTSSYHIPVKNQVEDILESIKQVMKIYQSGAYPYLDLSDLTVTTPTLFLQLLSQTCMTLLGEGLLSQSSSVFLRMDHPDIFNFIENFDHLSTNFFERQVGLTSEFLNAVIKNDVFCLINPQNKKIERKIEARSLFKVLLSRILDGTRINLIFLDAAQKKGSFLLPDETYPQGFINLSVMRHHQEVDWERMKIVTHHSVHFLDNVIELNNYPFKEAYETTHHHRRIGLGVIGFADLLEALKITYGSEQSFEVAKDLIGFIAQEAESASKKLALVRGAFRHYLLSLPPAHQESQLIGCSHSIGPKHPVKLNPEVPLKMAAIFQKYVDGKVDQQIVLPQNIKNSELASLIFLAFETKLVSLTFT